MKKAFNIAILFFGGCCFLVELLYIIKPTLFPDWFTEGGTFVSLVIIVIWLVFGIVLLRKKGK